MPSEPRKPAPGHTAPKKPSKRTARLRAPLSDTSFTAAHVGRSLQSGPNGRSTAVGRAVAGVSGQEGVRSRRSVAHVRRHRAFLPCRHFFLSRETRRKGFSFLSNDSFYCF